MIEFSCTSCGKRYKLEDQMGGKRAKCKCGNVLLVPLATIEPHLKSPVAPSAPPAHRAAVSAPVAAPPASSTECPSCGAEMAAAAVLCVECGYDKRTGKRLSGV